MLHQNRNRTALKEAKLSLGNGSISGAVQNRIDNLGGQKDAQILLRMPPELKRRLRAAVQDINSGLKRHKRLQMAEVLRTLITVYLDDLDASKVRH